MVYLSWNINIESGDVAQKNVNSSMIVVPSLVLLESYNTLVSTMKKMICVLVERK